MFISDTTQDVCICIYVSQDSSSQLFLCSKLGSALSVMPRSSTFFLVMREQPVSSIPGYFKLNIEMTTHKQKYQSQPTLTLLPGFFYSLLSGMQCMPMSTALSCTCMQPRPKKAQVHTELDEENQLNAFPISLDSSVEDESSPDSSPGTYCPMRGKLRTLFINNSITCKTADKGSCIRLPWVMMPWQFWTDACRFTVAILVLHCFHKKTMQTQQDFRNESCKQSNRNPPPSNLLRVAVVLDKTVSPKTPRKQQTKTYIKTAPSAWSPQSQSKRYL